MRSLRRWNALAASIGLSIGTVLVPVTAASAAPTTYTISVDNAAPTGHNWLYVDFFPRSGLKVHQGDVVDFAWAVVPDGFHTATLLHQGETPDQAFASTPLVSPDSDDSATQLALNPAILAPTDPTCGTAGNPCSYQHFNGASQDLNSGAMPTAPSTHFFVTLDVAAPATVTYVCHIHPGMVGSIDVVDNATAASTTQSVTAAATTQYNQDTTDALAAEAAANSAAYKHNADGTNTVTVTAGTATPFVEVAEMLPRDVHVGAGDTVKFVTTTIKDIHTVTFPEGSGSDGVDPLPAVCEANPTDTPATGPPPDFGCGNPANAENHFDPQPLGTTSIASPQAVGSSGILATPPAPFPSTYSFTFPNAGVFSYQCRIHDHMDGTIYATPAPGYRQVASDGGVFNYGKAGFLGSAGNTKLNQPVVGIAQTPDGGYWIAARDGGVFSFGDAAFLGSMGAKPLSKPVVGIIGTPTGNGYWLVASDGGVFNFGDAAFFGSTGGLTLNKPIVGIVGTPTGKGYWLVASDGGVFNFGDAAFLGSMGAKPLNKPVVGIAATPTGKGYWLVASDGGVFNFGDASFLGSMGGKPLNAPIVGMATNLAGSGYLLTAADGGIFALGDIPFAGSAGALKLNAPVMAIEAV